MLYRRQSYPEPNKLNLHVCIIGCGGVGSNSAISLALSGLVQSLTLIDGDEWERHNLNRVHFTPEECGNNKATSTAEYIKKRRNIDVFDIPHHLDTDDEIGIEFDYVISCADGEKANNAVRHHFHHYIENGNFIKAGAEGEQVTISETPCDWIVDNENHDYDNVTYMSCMSAAMAVCYELRHREDLIRDEDYDIQNVNENWGPNDTTFNPDPIGHHFKRIEIDSLKDKRDNLRQQLNNKLDKLRDLRQKMVEYEDFKAALNTFLGGDQTQ